MQPARIPFPAAAAALTIWLSCGPHPEIVLEAPTPGAFVDAAAVEVRGRVEPAGEGLELRVGGEPVGIDADGRFATALALAPDRIFHSVVAVLSVGGERLDREVVTVVAGPAVPEDAFAAEALGLRLTDAGLDRVEAGLADAVPLDFSDLLPPGTVVFDDLCLVSTPLACALAVDVVVSGDPPPSVGRLGVELDAQADRARFDTTVNDLFVRTEVRDATLGAPLCEIDLAADSTTISGAYALEPDPVDPTRVDVDQLGDVGVGFMEFRDTTDCGPVLGPALELLVSLLVPDVESLARDGFRDFLADPDGGGPDDAVVADLIEGTLADLALAATLGQGLGVDLAAEFFAVDEDAEGLTLGMDTRVAPAVLDPEAVDLSAALGVPAPFPPLGALAPATGASYDLALALSPTFFNQILKTQIEGGLLRTEVTELDLLGSGQPLELTAQILAVLDPAFAELPPQTPVAIAIAPRVAPVLTGEAGPAGELAEVRVGGLRVEARTPDRTVLAVDVAARVGLDLVYAAEAGALAAVLSAPAQEDVEVVFVGNPFGADEGRLGGIIAGLVTALFPSLTEGATEFPVPELLGLRLEPVEVSASEGGFVNLYADLVAD